MFKSYSNPQCYSYKCTCIYPLPSTTGYLPFVAFGEAVAVLSGTDDGYSNPIYSNQGIPFGTSIQYQAYVRTMQFE